MMRCSNYEFALNIKRKYNGLSRDHNHLSELTEPELRRLALYNILQHTYACARVHVIDTQ